MSLRLSLSVCRARRHLRQSINGRYLSTPAAAKSPKEKPQAARESNSFIMNMFCGQAKVVQVFPYPDVLDSDERETLTMIQDSGMKMYGELNDAAKNDQDEKVPDSMVEALKASGTFGLMVPTEYGGIALNNTQYARVGELGGGQDLGVSIFIGAHQSIGYKGLLLYGTDEQKAKYLPDLASGKRIAAYCLTEPSSGSDASSIRSRAVLSADGSQYVLNGSKIWISNGGIADFFTVFAQTPSTNKKGEPADKITAFIVERSMAGLTSGPPEKKMGIRCSNTAEVFFDNVKIPAENVLGEPGEGFKVAMNILNAGRFGMSAALSGTMRALIKQATEHASGRVQFGSKISTYETTQEKIARMSMAHYITESFAYMVAGNMDSGHTDYQLEAAVSKVFASEAAWYVCDETIQILGGMGYMRDAGVEKVMRDLRIFRIFEGTNDILKLFTALTGLQYAGGHLKELQRAMQNPMANLGLMMDEGTKRVFRAVGLSSAPSLTEHVHGSMKDSANNVSKCIEMFGATVEHLLIKHNKNIIHQQFLLNRLATSVIDIYAMVTVLSRATNAFNKGFPSAQHEAEMVNIICSEAKARVLSNLTIVRTPENLKNFNGMKNIADRVYEANGVYQTHPIDGIN